MDYHFNVCFFSVKTRLLLWISYRNFSFHHAIRFRPVKGIVTRVLPYSKRLDNLEAEFHFHVKTFPLKSCSKIRYPAHVRVVPFPVNRTLRVFSCSLLANNTLKPVNCLRQLPVSFVFKLTHFVLFLFLNRQFSLLND